MTGMVLAIDSPAMLQRRAAPRPTPRIANEVILDPASGPVSKVVWCLSLRWHQNKDNGTGKEQRTKEECS